MKSYIKLLTIAGSDSGGGAGIQADLKTFSALGCYGMSVITALTAQNTVGVTDVFPIPPEFIRKQLLAVLSDIGADGIKTGMLHSAEIIKETSSALGQLQNIPIVVDPVLLSKDGTKLLQENAIDALKELLLPLASLLTPNIPEAEALLGYSIRTSELMEQAAKDLCSMGPKYVLVKGGHADFQSENESADVLYDSLQKKITWYPSPRIDTKNIHGTGCTLSAAIASFLAKGLIGEKAVAEAKQYVSEAIERGSEYQIGNGHGPLHHFSRWW